MISVIVPVYNGEMFLEDTLRSISAQTYGDFEVIMVDDGSTDGSLSIMERFSATDNRFRIVRRPNGGLSAARNTGLDHAHGEWIYFIDADDTARPDALERLLNVAQTTGSPVVIGGYFESANENWPPVTDDGAPVVMTAGETLKIALYQKKRINSACGALFSSEIFHSEKFTEGLYYEDLDFFPRMCLRARQIAYFPEPLYFYRQHPGSFIHTFSRRRLDSLRVTNRVLDFIKKEMPELEPAARDRQMSAAFNVLLLLERYKPDTPVELAYQKYGATYDEIMNFCYAIIRKNRRAALFDRNVRLKNKLGALLSYGGRFSLRAFSRLSR